MQSNPIEKIIEENKHPYYEIAHKIHPNQMNQANEVLVKAIRDEVKEIQSKSHKDILEKNLGKEIQFLIIKDALYVVLQQKAQGVNTKILLIKAENLLATLEKLAKGGEEKISPDAMIKFARDSSSLNQEHIALKLLKTLLGNEIGEKQVAKSVLVEYEKDIGMFVPFDPMQELGNFVYLTDRWKASWKALGNALHPNTFVKEAIESLGEAYAFLLFSQDKDFFGKHCQNKGLLNNRLYFFDFTINTGATVNLFPFEIDEDLNFYPSNKSNRHLKCRNFSMINDLSVSHKIISFYDLIEKKSRFLTLIEDYKKRIVDQKLLTDSKNYSSLNYLSKFYYNLETIKKEIEQRISGLETILQEWEEKIKSKGTKEETSKEELIQLFILQKLLNNPVLFNADGHPYSYPYYNFEFHKENNLKLYNMKKGKNLTGQDIVKIYFEGNFAAKEVVSWLEKMNIKISINKKELYIEIKEDDFKQLTETTGFPENEDKFNQSTNYLCINDINRLQEAYKKQLNHKKDIKDLKETLQKYLEPSSLSSMEDIKKFKEKIDEFLKDNPSNPLIKHLAKKASFKIQQEISNCLKTEEKAVIEKMNFLFMQAIQLGIAPSFQEAILSGLDKGKNLLNSDLLYSDDLSNFSVFLNNLEEQFKNTCEQLKKNPTDSNPVANLANWIKNTSFYINDDLWRKNYLETVFKGPKSSQPNTTSPVFISTKPSQNQYFLKGEFGKKTEQCKKHLSKNQLWNQKP